MKYTPPMVLAVLLLIACSNNSAEPDLEADAGADAAVRTCDQGVIATTLNQPPCTWEWTCSDFTGPLPQYSAECVAATGDDVSCECREAGALTGTITVAGGCSTIANACQAANAACGFAKPITCPQ